MAISNEILPFGSPFLALFCLIPLYKALYNAKSFREAFLIFFVQTITVHLISSFWLANFHGFAIFTLGASALGTGALGGFTGMVVYIFPRTLQRMNSLELDGGKKSFVTGARVLWFCSSIVFWEWIKSTGFLAYPWGTLSMAAYRWKIITQIADITGVWGISFLFSMVSALIGEGFNLLDRLPHSQNPSSYGTAYIQCVKFAAVLFICAGIYGLFCYFQVRTPVKKFNAVIVQQNIDPWEGGDRSSISISSKLTEEEINKMRDEGQEPDLILWSEGVLSRPFPNSIEFYKNEYPEAETLSEFIARMRVPFIIGGTTMVDRYKRLYSNSAVLFDRDGKYSGFYSKIHLVPFAEQIPFADNPLMKWFMGDVVGMKASLTPGNQFVLFKIPLRSSNEVWAPLRENLPPYATIELDPTGRSDEEKTERYIANPDLSKNATVSFTTPICFEDAFSDVCSKLYKYGSEVFLNITNDSWSKKASSEYQHFIAASYRAIEYRTTLVRCANSGYSVVVDPVGKILYDMEVFKQKAISCRIPIYERKWTVYSILGDWFAYMLFFFMGLFLIKECAEASIPETVVKVKSKFKKLSKLRSRIAIQIEDTEPEIDSADDDKMQIEDNPAEADFKPTEPTANIEETKAKRDRKAQSLLAEIVLNSLEEKPRRGRKPKAVVAENAINSDEQKPIRGRKPKAVVAENVINSVEEKPKRGRKPKSVAAENVINSDEQKPRRGRKPKAVVAETPVNSSEEKSKRGRKPKSVVAENAINSDEQKPRRGRKPKAVVAENAINSDEQKPKRGRKPKVVVAETQVNSSEQKSKRGRKPKVTAEKTVLNTEVKSSKRGRKPKADEQKKSLAIKKTAGTIKSSSAKKKG